jgi:flagellar hook-associated protein 3 FlgL
VTVTTNSLDLTSLLDEFTTDYNRMLASRATLGARMDNVSSATSSLGDSYTTYKGLMTDNENIDTATAATELTSAEYTYEAALAVGAKVISKSLIDYIA